MAHRTRTRIRVPEGQGALPAAQAALIVTTEPELFLPWLGRDAGETVFVCCSGMQAIERLAGGECACVVADYRELVDHWTGQRLLKLVRKQQAYDDMEFWLMAEHWQTHQELLAMQAGASGMMRRCPSQVARHVLDRPAQLPAALAARLEAIDDLFLSFSGPSLQAVADARRQVLHGRIAASPQDYAKLLVSQITPRRQSVAFMLAVQSLPGW